MISTSSTPLTGTNALVTPLVLTNARGVIAGTGSIEFAGNTTRGDSFENNGGNQILTNSLTGGAILTFSTNPVFLDNSGDTSARTLTLAGAGATNISSPIANGGTQANGFAYSGTGALGLTGVSTFTGAAILNGGSTTISGAGVFGLTGTLTVNPSASLTLDNTGTQHPKPPRWPPGHA